MKRSSNLIRVLSAFLMLFSLSSVSAQNYLINEDFENFPSSISSIPYQGWSSTTSVGDSTFDKWLFDNPYGYSVPGPMNGKVGIVDCYNAGQAGTGSNGGRAQTVSLNSPSVDATGLTNLTLEFDHMFLDLANATCYVEVSTNAGSTWTTLATYTTVMFSGQSVSMNMDAYAGNADVRLRFRWYNPNTTTTHGYWMVDQVRLYSRFTNDVTVEAIDKPLNNSCPTAKQPMEVVVKNFGTASASNISVNLGVSGGTTYSASTTIANLAAGASVSVFTADSINTNAGGNFNLEASVSMAGDLNTLNDTVRVTRTTAPTPTDPSGLPIVQCGVGAVTLTCNSNPGEFTVWYNDSLTSAALGDGNPYQTNFTTYASRRFYAENTRNLASYFTNYTTGVYRYNSASEKGIFFDVTTTNEIVLDSLQSNWAYAGTYEIKVYYKTGTYLTSVFNQGDWILLGVDTVSPAGLGQVATIDPKASLRIGAGQTYGFVITSRPIFGGLPPFAFKQGTSNVSNEDLTVFANTVAESVFINSLTGYSADINIYYQKVCKSQRKGIDVVIIPKPAGVEAASTTPYNGFYNAGTAMQPDYAKINDTVTYELLAPTGYTYAQYGTGWMITDLKMMTANGTPPISTDTATFAPTLSVGASLRFVPSDYIDSVYYIEATVLDIAKNCDTTIRRHVVIAAEPSASFTAPSACEGNTIQFTNQSSVLSGVLHYKWYFGDGDSSDQVNPVHLYSNANTYNVTLIATTDYGFSAQFDTTITVFEIPDADFIVENECDGMALDFNDASMLPVGTPSYEWNFGDGSPLNTSQNPSYLYASSGSYTVSMTVTVNGCSDSKTRYATQGPRAIPSFTSQTACNNSNAVFNNTSTLSTGTFGSTWKFGDNTTSNLKNPSHKYTGFGTFDVTLITTTDLGCVDSVTNSVSLTEAPIPDFMLSNACSNEDITFNNLTNVPAGGANNYTWNISGTISNSFSPSHQFGSPGTYTVKLAVANNNGCSDSITRIIQIDTKPIAQFVAEDVCEGDPVVFQNNTVNIPMGASYVWEFDNGTNSTAEDTSVLLVAGSYDVKLFAITNNGCVDTTEKTVKVNQLPDASFLFSSTLMADGSFAFSGPIGTGYHYQWFMGDGSKYTNRDIDHKFILGGSYTVTLIVTSPEGCVSQTSQTVNSNPTSAERLSAGKLNVYPVPSQGTVTVDLSALPKASYQLVVRDLTGKVVMQLNSDVESLVQLDLSNLAEGSYVIQVNGSDQVYSAKVQLVK